MKSVRQGVFESNSSSMHSISFATPDSYRKYNYKGQCLYWTGGEFGWEDRMYLDPRDKFSYWLTAFANYLQVKQLEDIKKSYPKVRFLVDNEKERRKYLNDKYYCYTNEEVILPDEKSTLYIKNFAVKRITDVYNLFKKKEIDFIDFTFFDYRENKLIKETCEKDFQDWLEYLRNLKSFPDFRNIGNLIDFDGYIDHQSAPSEDSDCYELAAMEPEYVFNWVFGNGSFKTGNDNG